MNTTERAAEIRQALKAKGITSRQVSVRSDYYSMGSSIDVRIKDPAVSLTMVQALAEAHESIRYCEVSGEILSGGNRYVSVGYTEEAIKVQIAPILPAVEAAVAAVVPGSNSLKDVEGTDYLVGRPHVESPNTVTVWRESFIGQAYGPTQAAELIVRAIAKVKA